MVNRTPIADDVIVVGWVTENSDTGQIHSADILLKCSLTYRTLNKVSE
jgi:hypothetical protein